jgi:hypothetical protein
MGNTVIATMIGVHPNLTIESAIWSIYTVHLDRRR